MPRINPNQSYNINAEYQGSRLNGVVRIHGTKFGVHIGRHFEFLKNLKKLKNMFLDIHAFNIYTKFQGSRLNSLARIYGTKFCGHVGPYSRVYILDVNPFLFPTPILNSSLL